MKVLLFTLMIFIGCNSSSTHITEPADNCTTYFNMEKIGLYECKTYHKEVDQIGLKSFGIISNIHNLKVINFQNHKYYACNLPDTFNLETLIYFHYNTLKVDSIEDVIAQPIDLKKLWIIK